MCDNVNLWNLSKIYLSTQKSRLFHYICAVWDVKHLIAADEKRWCLIKSLFDLNWFTCIKHLPSKLFVDRSDVVGAPSFSTEYLASMDLTKTINCKTRRESFKFWNSVRLILDVWRYIQYRLSALTEHILPSCLLRNKPFIAQVR